MPQWSCPQLVLWEAGFRLSRFTKLVLGGNGFSDLPLMPYLQWTNVFCSCLLRKSHNRAGGQPPQKWVDLAVIHAVWMSETLGKITDNID